MKVRLITMRMVLAVAVMMDDARLACTACPESHQVRTWYVSRQIAVCSGTPSRHTPILGLLRQSVTACHQAYNCSRRT